MFVALTDAVDTLDIPVERDAIVGAIALCDRIEGKIAAAVGEFQARGLHELAGSVTMSTWLRHRAGVDGTAAVVAARRAAKLHRLPVLRPVADRPRHRRRHQGDAGVAVAR